MNNKKAQIVELQKQLENLKELEAILIEREHSKNLNHDIYDSGSNLFLLSNAFKKQNYNSFKELKMVRAAKNLNSFAKEEVTAYIMQLSESLIKNIDNCNKESSLTPRLKDINKLIEDTIKLSSINFNNSILDIYNDIFNQGRFHQTLYQSPKSLNKFSSLIDNLSFKKKLDNKIESQFDLVFAGIKKHLSESSKDLLHKNASRQELNDELNKIIESYDINLKNLVYNQFLEVYATGNFYQLYLDKTDKVIWKINNLFSDCQDCRAIQNGDIILPIAHTRDLSGDVIYQFADLWEKVNEKGARFFNHEGCTCAFIPVNDFNHLIEK